MDDDMMAAMGFGGFGKAKSKRTLDPKRFDKTKRAEEEAGVAVPATVPETQQGESVATGPSTLNTALADDDDTPGPAPTPFGPEFEPSEDGDDDESGELFPATHELVLKDHTKVVSALALDPSGARVLSGAHDYDCKLWDFGGMDARCKPFKTWEPAGTYYINDLKYSNDGQRFLVISGTIQAKIYDRDGEEGLPFMKGDPYIRDMKNTAGHVAEITSCAWHPKQANTFITSSADSTIRIWDTEDRRKQKTVIVVKSKERGARTKVTYCAYSPDGGIIAGACEDGTLHLWNTSSNFARPNQTVEGAHTKPSATGSISFSVDGRTLLTRSSDHTVKLWDIRAFKKPLAVREDLPALYTNTNAIFSPDDKHVLTGASSTTKGGQGRLVFMKKEGLEIVQELPVKSTPIRVLWHSKINQILAGMSDGQISVFYSPETSLNGAKLPMSKGPRKKVTIEDVSAAESAAILTPYAEGEIVSGKRKREKDRNDPRKSRRPELPLTGPGKGGRVGASATQHVVQNLVRDTTRDEDPREALLKYADTSKDPKWTAAWSANQPKPVFAAVEEEEEEGSDAGA